MSIMGCPVSLSIFIVKWRSSQFFAISLKQKHANFSFSASSLEISSREFQKFFHFNHAAKNIGLKRSNQLV